MICGRGAASLSQLTKRRDRAATADRARGKLMRHGLLVAALLLVALPVALAGEVRTGLAVASQALGRDVPYTLYLPADYTVSDRRHPVLFLLHGHGGSELDWVRAGRLATTLDRLIESGAVPSMLVVMPGMGDSWYVDDPTPGAVGLMETAFLADLIPAIDRQWRSGDDRAGRAVAGLSMGGFGALRFAMLRPDLFAAAASLSGALLTDARAADSDWAPWLAAAFGTPVDLTRYRAASPFGLLPAFAAGERRPALYLSCGDDDELGLEEGTLLFYLALRRAGVRTELRITDGGHDWSVWSRELDPMLRFVGKALATRPDRGPP
jgi:S-formylglutathione hydrolase FrmB